MPEYVVEVPEVNYRKYVVVADDKSSAEEEVRKYRGTPLRCMRRSTGVDDAPRVYKVSNRSEIFQQDEEKAAKEAVKHLADWINDMGADLDGFVEELHKEHRTLQQKATSLFLRWLYSLAELREGQYDLRNEAAVRAANKIKEALGYCGDRLPFI